MSYYELTLERPDPGLPPYKEIVIPTFAIDGGYDGYKITAGEQFGIANIWKLVKGSILLTASAAVANRNISTNVYLDAGGTSGFGVSGLKGQAIAASNIGNMSFGGIGVITGPTIYGAGSVYDYFQVTKDFIFKGGDYFVFFALNEQAGDTMAAYLQFEYLNRAMGVKEKL